MAVSFPLNSKSTSTPLPVTSRTTFRRSSSRGFTRRSA